MGLRGAITVERDDSAAILEATETLLRSLIEANGLTPRDVVSVLLTVTTDLSSAFPAQAARRLGWHDVAILHATEIPVPGALPHCIRVLLHAYLPRDGQERKHRYLRGAQVLRPDRA